MAEGGGEKSTLGKFVKNQTKYGATKKVFKPQETYITHTLLSGETLQGIALAYGVSMEQIKRVNKLWTNDSLYLRDTLQIPIPIPKITNSASLDSIHNGDADVNCGASTSQASSLSEQSNAVGQHRPITKSKSEHSCLKSVTDSEAKLGASSKDINAKDFLSQFDSSLALMKSNVERMMCNTNFGEEDKSNPLTFLPSKKNKYGPKHRAKTLDLLDPAKSPELHIRSPTNSKKLRNSYQDMEKKEAEIFEL